MALHYLVMKGVDPSSPLPRMNNAYGMRGPLGALLLLAAVGTYADYRSLLRAGTGFEWDNVAVGDAGSGSGVTTLLEAGLGGGDPPQQGGVGPDFSGSGSGSGTPFIAVNYSINIYSEYPRVAMNFFYHTR